MTQQPSFATPQGTHWQTISQFEHNSVFSIQYLTRFECRTECRTRRRRREEERNSKRKLLTRRPTALEGCAKNLSYLQITALSLSDTTFTAQARASGRKTTLNDPAHTIALIATQDIFINLRAHPARATQYILLLLISYL